jgi:hypothetical protein
MAEIITLAFFGSVWLVSAVFDWILRVYVPGSTSQRDHVAKTALATAALGGFSLWLAFTLVGGAG